MGAGLTHFTPRAQRNLQRHSRAARGQPGTASPGTGTGTGTLRSEPCRSLALGHPPGQLEGGMQAAGTCREIFPLQHPAPESNSSVPSQYPSPVSIPVSQPSFPVWHPLFQPSSSPCPGSRTPFLLMVPLMVHGHSQLSPSPLGQGRILTFLSPHRPRSCSPCQDRAPPALWNGLQSPDPDPPGTSRILNRNSAVLGLL